MCVALFLYEMVRRDHDHVGTLFADSTAHIFELVVIFSGNEHVSGILYIIAQFDQGLVSDKQKIVARAVEFHHNQIVNVEAQCHYIIYRIAGNEQEFSCINSQNSHHGVGRNVVP